MLTRAAAIDPKNPRVWSAHGHAQLEAGQLQEAEQNLRQALALDQSNANANCSRAPSKLPLRCRSTPRLLCALALQFNPQLEIARRNIAAVGGES